MIKYPMTVEGAKSLEKEYQNLTKVIRPQLSEAIGIARALGDLKENAEYHAAREQQAMIEARIRDIEGRIQNSIVIDILTIPNTGKVIFGTTIEILNLETDESMVYKIVGENEADVKYGKISIIAPIAKAVIAKYEGDIVSVTTPKGTLEYQITKVSHI